MIPDNEATAYLKTCAKHEMGHKYGELNRSKRNISLDDETLDPQAAAFLADTSAEESALDRITLDEIWETISKLDAITYRIFIMRYSAEIPIADIANTLGMSYGNVCNRIYRTVKILSKKYSNSAPLKDECVSERKACIID
ncbi:hypothetical protein SDC9_128359 [bioreactor metagenome]|uniref:RNA polymerase sigma factor 70 region 4 type 2 domain-containing protein n=1 Tax=bioreactor metagenome TaxID=1076179 RepID=A0A645CWL7_9ZZZZ